MSIFCTHCGQERTEQTGTPCPNCGSGAITLVPPTAGLKWVGHAPILKMRRLEQELQKNWPLIAVLLACDTVSTIFSYFLSGWVSVAATLVSILISTAVGYYAITRKITVTIETL